MGRRLCIFSALFLPNMGGVEVFTDHLARTLEDEGHAVTIVTNDTHGKGERERLSEGVEVVRLPCWGLVGGRLPVPKPNRRLRALLRGLKRDAFDGVLVNTRFYPHSLIGAWLARRQGGRAVVLDHGADYLTFGNPLLDKVVEAYEHGVTAILKRFVPAFYGVSPSSVTWLSRFGIEGAGVIPNAIDAESYRSLASARSFRRELGVPSQAPVVSFVGRLVPEKGVREFVEAARLVSSSTPVAFVVAGEGPLEEELRRNAPSCVSLVGRLEPHDVAALLGESDLFCFPSRSEGFGSALLEAAICGALPITTDVGIARSLVPDESYGIVLDEPSAEKIAEAVDECVMRLADTKQRAARCAERAASLYSWEESAAALIDALDRAMPQR